MVRSSVILLVALTCAVLVLCRALIEDEAERVLTVHVADKANHLVNMLEASADGPEGLHSAIKAPDFVGMANASHVAAIYLFDRNGMDVTASNPIGADGSLLSSSTDSQIVGDHQNSELVPPSPPQVQSAWTQGRHFHHSHDTDVMAALAEAERPSAERWYAALAEQEDLFATFSSMRVNNEDHHYAQVVSPAHAPGGEIIGFIGLTLDVSHIYSAIGDGFAQFATLLIVLGVILFGVPAAGFWTQKRVAERSTRDVGYLSSHDTLTGLLNRSAFIAQTEEQMLSGKIGYIGYVDSDRFKLINDTYGHNVGDAFLIQIAHILEKRFGEQALVARFGGDEFTFALPQHSKARLKALIEAVRKEAQEEMQIDGFTIASSISIGIAKLHTGQSLETVLQQADQALYFAKSRGRNRAAFYTDAMGEAAAHRRQLEAWLRRSCREKSFEVAFQPLVDANSETVIGFEALLRLRDADGVPISPAEFVPLAESIGLIEEIGEWVLFEAIEKISQLNETVSVSVNLSAEQFKSERLVGLVKEALSRSDLDPKRLELEITESVLLEHEASTQNQIDSLKALGVRIAMDDFGTGFSSLSTLWRYGFDRIKIDKSFVQALEVSPERSMQLIDTMVLLAARMGMNITAEGIETEEQRDVLTRLGCDVLQGFFYGHPMPISHFAADTDLCEQGKQHSVS